jgi:hypothetical protein
VADLEDASREDLLALIAELRAVVAAQQEQIAALQRAVSRNSGNSSMPPSGDDQPGRRAPAQRPARSGTGKRGKRPGAPGSGLAWRVSPDATVAHHPRGLCGCGSDLAAAVDEGVARSHQVHEVPLASANVVQHDLHAARCGCGRRHVAARPGDVVADAPVSYGPNLRALVVYLLVFQHVPVARCAQLVADLTGARPSTGFIHAMLARAADAVADVIKLIRALITAAVVAGFDETTLRVGPAGTRKYVLSASTDTCALFWLGRRDLQTFTAFGILPASTGIAVHDRYSLYDHPDLTGRLAGHQLCTAHLLRDLADAAETYPDQHWPPQAIRALRALIGAAATARAAGQPAVPTDITEPLIQEFRQAVAVGLSQIPRVPGPTSTTKQPIGRLLLECLRDRHHDVLRFLTDTRIWPTNNTSERDLRPLKTQQKISGRLTSDTTTRHRLALRSYITTAAKHGINIMTALHDAITGQPWMPPAPAGT